MSRERGKLDGRNLAGWIVIVITINIIVIIINIIIVITMIVIELMVYDNVTKVLYLIIRLIDHQVRMREVQGAICIASIVQLVIGYTGICVTYWSLTS